MRGFPPCRRDLLRRWIVSLWCSRLLRPASDALQPLHNRDGLYHLVQDRPGLERILAEELPPEEYYDELARILRAKFPRADPKLVEHAVPLAAAFDRATAFALSFGIAKFQLAHIKAKLVGEIVARDGRSPNPEIVRAIKKVAAYQDPKGPSGRSRNSELRSGPCRTCLLPNLSAIEASAPSRSQVFSE